MAYHLSQLSSEVTLESNVSQQVKSAIAKTETFNSHVYKIISIEKLLESIQASYLETFKQHVESLVSLELENVSLDYQSQIDFVLKDSNSFQLLQSKIIK